MRPTPQDYVAISELFARYCMSLSVHDCEGWVALYAPDGSFKVHGRSWDGHEGLRKMVNARDAGLHLGGQPTIWLTDDGHAHTTRNMFVYDRNDGSTRCAVYDDDLRRTPEGWRIVTTRCRFITAEGISDRPPRPAESQLKKP